MSALPEVHVTSVRPVGVRLFQPHCSCDWAGLLYPTTYVAGLVAAEHENGWNNNPTAGLWGKRNTSSGHFEAVKRSGDVFKGVKREN